MTTEEGNKLIAVFDGKEKVHPNDLKFHYSWDWLQPAWSKFYLLCETGLRDSEKLYNEFADFRDNYNIHANHGNVNAACETLIEAIQWYNTTVKKEDHE